MKQILMIHEWNDKFYDMKDTLEKYIITLDDGLVSQYRALEFLKTLSTIKIFFISTGIVRSDQVQASDEVTKCADAHINAFTGDYGDYMSWKEIQEIHNSPFCYIGGHGHNHLKLWETKGLRERFTLINQDTKKMFQEFKRHNIKIDKFCFPYNYEDDLLRGVCKKNNITKFYDGSRKAIEDLI